MAVQAVLGGELAWVADNDPGASAILARRFPSVPNHTDITAADWARDRARGHRRRRVPLPAGLAGRQATRRSR